EPRVSHVSRPLGGPRFTALLRDPPVGPRQVLTLRGRPRHWHLHKTAPLVAISPHSRVTTDYGKLYALCRPFAAWQTRQRHSRVRLKETWWASTTRCPA